MFVSQTTTKIKRDILRTAKSFQLYNTVGSLYRTVLNNGSAPFTNGPSYFKSTTQPVPILAMEHWAAFIVNEDNWGLGVF